MATVAFAPFIGIGVVVTPTPGSLSTATFAPVVLTPRVVIPSTAALATVAFAPFIGIGVVVAPTPGSLSTATFAPVVLTGAVIIPGSGSLTIVTFAPMIQFPITTPDSRKVTVSARTAQISSGSSDRVLSVGRDTRVSQS